MTMIYGVALSPYVRKVLLVLEAKGVSYENNGITPLDIPDWFENISPLKKIPAFEDEQLTVSDSSIIIEYLHERYPDVPLLPDSLSDRARSRWFEEYADTALMQAVGGPIFFERFVRGRLLGQEVDEARVQNAIDELVPPVFDYLESQVAGAEYLFDGRLSVADVALGSLMRNAELGELTVDASRWPKFAAYVKFVHSDPVFAARIAAEIKDFSL